MQGQILTIIPSRKVGFIAAEDGDEVFFECSCLKGEERSKFKSGTKVTFEMDGPLGTPAKNIKRIK